MQTKVKTIPGRLGQVVAKMTEGGEKKEKEVI